MYPDELAPSIPDGFSNLGAFPAAPAAVAKPSVATASAATPATSAVTLPRHRAVCMMLRVIMWTLLFRVVRVFFPYVVKGDDRSASASP